MHVVQEERAYISRQHAVAAMMPYRAAFVIVRQTGENYIWQNSRENLDCKFYVFACNNNKALQPARTYCRHGRL